MNPFDPYPEEETTTELVPSESYTYPPSLAHDLACCVSDEEIEAVKVKYEYDSTDLELIINRPDFKREYSEWRQRLVSEGNSFKLKLRAMAEEFLPQLHRIMNSEATAPSVKLSAFQYITKVSELEPPKESSSNGGQSGNSPVQVVVQIKNYATPNSAKTTINVTPVVCADE
jgi:hypothetical protein